RVDPSTANHVFIVPGVFPTGVFGTTHVWSTTNGGTKWTDIGGGLPSEDWTVALAVDWRFSTPGLYVAPARGVSSSTNLGGSWAKFGMGQPNAVDTDLEFLQQAGILAVATYGRGVFEISISGPSGPSSWPTPRIHVTSSAEPAPAPMVLAV